MGISVDMTKMDKLEKLEAMLELMQNSGNPAFLADVKTTLKQLQDATKRYTTVEAAERFLQEAKDILETAKEEAKQVRTELEVETSAIVNKKQELSQLVSQKTIELHDKESVLQDKEISLALAQEQLDKKIALSEAQNTTTVRHLDGRHQELSKREQEMNSKEDALKKLFKF